MLTGSLTQTVPIPHEPGETMTFKRPSWRDLDLARQARSREAISNLRGLGDVLRELQSPESQTKAATAAADPTNDYDRATLLGRCLVAWSYPDPVTPETIASLDEQTAAWAMAEIVPKPLTDAERLLDSALSTMPSGVSAAP